jgi:hypothetical protein
LGLSDTVLSSKEAGLGCYGRKYAAPSGNSPTATDSTQKLISQAMSKYPSIILKELVPLSFRPLLPLQLLFKFRDGILSTPMCSG